MPDAARWFRVNTTWSQSEWLADLPPASRLAWIELLGYVKAHGYDGKARAVSPSVFGRMYGIPAKDVQALLDAALADGALRADDGSWTITGWTAHQGDPTGAQRVRRYRERKEKEAQVTDVTRYDRVVTATETETETEEPPVVPHGGTGDEGAEAKPKRSRATTAKGSRTAPADFKPDPEIAAGIGLDTAWAAHELAGFRDWVFRTPRSDWPKTWRNWCRNAFADGRPRGLPHANGNGAHHPGDADWRSAQGRERAAYEAWAAEVEPLLRAADKAVKQAVRAQAEARCEALKEQAGYPRFVKAACLSLYGERIGKPQP